MQLEMKTQCEKCGDALPGSASSYICSYEYTLCSACAEKAQRVCPHCGGELISRPRRDGLKEISGSSEARIPTIQSPQVWMASFGVWSLVALAASFSIFEFDRAIGRSFYFHNVLGLEFSQILSYAPLTPFVLWLAVRFPIQRTNWRRRLPMFLAAGIMFSVLHVVLRGITPFAMWEPEKQRWVSGVWDGDHHVFHIRRDVFKFLLYINLVDDLSGVFAPIVIVAHMLSFYKKFRERDLRALQLEGQLAKAHLQALKSQIQPHFLFNTLHSISALMHTDVQAADKMMSRLSDLLRMSLDNDGVQITTLSRELEFVTGYLVIESIRFDDRLSVSLDIAPDTLDAQVPHLLLQPLVENAVRHGIAKLSSPGEIKIISGHDGRTLSLSIQDNGPGFDALSARQTRGGLGLKATRERMQTLYGHDQSLSIHNLPGQGVEVAVQIPFRVNPEASASEMLAEDLEPTA